MGGIKGWLYVGRQSATFVSDNPHMGMEKYYWAVLADDLLLKNFLTFFQPQKQARESSYDGFYVELDEAVLEAWFECVLPVSESSVL